MEKYNRLCLEERKEIFCLDAKGFGVRAIARELGRDPSVISRELRRNADSIGYLPDTAHQKAANRRTHRKKKIINDENIRQYVIEKLRCQWSPEQIAGRMKVEKMKNQISHEPIYQFIYSEHGKALGLYKFLRYRQQKRCQIFGRKYRSRGIKDRISIAQRPAEVANRAVPGNFEGDLTFFYGNKSANLTVLTDRSSRYTMLIKNKSKHSNLVIDGIMKKIMGLPIKSITFDNGTEFALHKRLLDEMGIATYFCDPGSPWQKGSVENSINRLHRFIAKKENINTWSDQEIEKVERRMNSIPRKVLGYLTPYQVFSGQSGGVAFHS
jgi:IS30 family transposase